MSSTACYNATAGGETDLQEILQLLCSDISTDGSLPPPIYTRQESQIESALFTDASLEASTYEFQYSDDLALDLLQQTPDQFFPQGDADVWDDTIQLHAQRRKEVERFGIDLGVSNILAIPIRTHSSYPVLEAQLREELVALYFDYVHPLCPAIDEQNFWWHFIALSEAEFFELFPAIMFNAMLFAAFGHATEEQVRRAGYSSVYEIQSLYYRVLSEMYDRARPQVLTGMDEVVLAKTSLLLSLWCPPKMEITANSLWVDRALYHTKRYLRKTSSAVYTSIPKRRDILIWCCISRKTLISYAMRRPCWPCMEDEAVCDPDDLRSEFERELQFHNFCSPAAKIRMVEDFVTMCKLSKNLRASLYTQPPLPSALPGLSHTTILQQGNELELHDSLSRYIKAAEVEAELVDLIELHERIKCEGANRGGSERATEVVAARMRSYVLQIITFSSIVSLYQSAIATKSSKWARSCYSTALTKLFDASKKVACIVEHMLSDVPVEAIPGTLLVWITWPMIPLLVEQNCSKFGLPGLSADIDSDFDSDSDSEGPNDLAVSSSHARDIASLMELTSRLAPRFHSARDAWALLQHADHAMCLDAATANLERVRRASTASIDTIDGRLAAVGTDGSWDLFVKAMKFVESKIEDKEYTI